MVMTLRPVPVEDRIAELEGVPLFYTVGGPFYPLEERPGA